MNHENSNPLPNHFTPGLNIIRSDRKVQASHDGQY